MEKIIMIYLTMVANEAHFLRVLPKGEVLCEHPFALHLLQPKKGKDKADVVPLRKKLFRRPLYSLIYALVIGNE